MALTDRTSVKSTKTTKPVIEEIAPINLNDGYFHIKNYLKDWARVHIFATRRNVGKTTDLLAYVGEKAQNETYTHIDPFTRKPITKNKEFFGLRRSEKEVIEFLIGIKDAIRRLGLKVVGNVFYDANDQIVGRVGYLSGSSNYKSSDFSHNCILVFDEFIAEIGKNYLPNEYTLFLQLLITLERFKIDKNASDGIAFEVFMISNRNSDNNPYFTTLDIWFDGQEKGVGKHARMIERPEHKIVAYNLQDSDFNIPHDKSTISRMLAQYDSQTYGTSFLGVNTYDPNKHLIVNPNRVSGYKPIMKVMLRNKLCVLYKYDQGYMLCYNWNKNLENNQVLNTIYLEDSLIYGEPNSIKMVITFCEQLKSYMVNKMLKFNNYDIILLVVEMITNVLGKTENGEEN